MKTLTRIMSLATALTLFSSLTFSGVALAVAPDSIEVKTSSTAPESDILVAGTSNNWVSEAEIKNNNQETISIRELSIATSAHTADTEKIYIQYTDALGQVETRVALPILDPITQDYSAALFSGLDFQIAQGNSAKIKILADINPYSLGGGSGEKISFGIIPGSIEYLKMASGQISRAANYRAHYKEHQILSTKPTLTLSSNNPEKWHAQAFGTQTTVLIVDVNNANSSFTLNDLDLNLMSKTGDINTRAVSKPQLYVNGQLVAEGTYWMDSSRHGVMSFRGLNKNFSQGHSELSIVLNLEDLIDEDFGNDLLNFSIDLGRMGNDGGMVWTDQRGTETGWLGYFANRNKVSPQLWY